jgi:CBS domain-containing protein
MICPSCSHENIEGMDRCEECLTPLTKLDIPRADGSEGLARSVMEDNLAQLEQEEAILVGVDTPTLDVVRKMGVERKGCALVMDGNTLAGIFTEHDVLKKLNHADPDCTGVAVKSLMSANPETLDEADSVAAALNKMSMGRYRHIPVARKDGSYTVVSIKEVLKYIAQENW